MDRLNQDFGFGIVPKQAMKDTKLSVASKGLYAYLCSYAGNKDTAFPSISLITHELNISKDTFYKYMKELKENNYIFSTQITEKGKFSHSVYNLLPCSKSSDTELSYTESSYTTNMDTNINSSNKNNLNKNNNIYIPFSEIIKYLNLKASTNYKPNGSKTKTLIAARFNESFTLEDFKKVIDNKTAEWIGTDYEKFLRPETLFSNKFESYLNQKGGVKTGTVRNKSAGNGGSYEGFKPKKPIEISAEDRRRAELELE